MQAQNKQTVKFAILAILLIILAIFDLYIGSVNIPLNIILKSFINTEAIDKKWLLILYQIRLPRVMTAIIVGISLSVSGLMMQTIFRNPLAGPYVLGISSGAGFGVAILLLGSSIFFAGSDIYASNWTIVFAACLGALAILLIILVVSYRLKDILTILILGIMLGSVLSALVSILQYFSNETMLKSYVLWTLGSLSGVTTEQLKVFSLICLSGILISFLTAKKLNVLLLGESYSKSLGVSMFKTRLLLFISTSLLAGSVTAFCGPIGFIGIAIPHISRMFFKTSNHFVLIPASIFIGSIVMIFSDIIAQVPGNNIVLPINSVTSLIGIPVVIFIVIKNYKFG